MEEVGLHTVEHYIDVRRQTIANFIVNRPIFKFCTEARRKRGTAPRQFWWDQQFDLDEARAHALHGAVVADSEED